MDELMRMKYLGVCHLLTRIAGKKNYDRVDSMLVERALMDCVNLCGGHRVIKTTSPSGFGLEIVEAQKHGRA